MMATNTITSGDSSMTLTMAVSDTTLGVEDVPVTAMFSALDALNQQAPIGTVTYTLGTITIALKDERSFMTNIRPGPPPTFNVVSQSFWTVDELSYLRALENTLVPLIATNGMSSLTVTYA